MENSNGQCSLEFLREPDRIEWKELTGKEQQALLPKQATRHPKDARFHELLGELAALYNKKQLDYGKGDDPFANVRGAEEWGIPAWVGAMIRATDKIKRLQTFAAKGSLANEGVEDSFKDLAVYAMIGLCLYEEARIGADRNRLP